MARGNVAKNPFHKPTKGDLMRRAKRKFRKLRREDKKIDLRKKKK